MISWQTLNTIFQDETSDISPANVTRGNRYINQIYRNILRYWNWPFLEGTLTTTTVASQQAYTLPYNYKRMKSLTITSGSTVYPVKEIADWELWNYLNQWGTTYTSDIPQYFFIKDDLEVQIYPIPASAGNTITLVFEKNIKDMANNDYTTGTASITTATSKFNVTGSATTWTAGMVGRFFNFTTDNYWYEIRTFTSTTAIVLLRAYGGSDVSGGAYTIGEMPIIPEDFHDLLWLGASGWYWTLKREDNHAAFYLRQFKDGMEKMKQRFGYKSTGQYIKGFNLEDVIDPNEYPTDLT